MNVGIKAVLLFVAIGLCFPLFTAVAEEKRVNLPFKPDPIRGHQTALKLCASCHIVGTEYKVSVQPGVPSFSYIGNMEGQNKDRLAHVMIHPRNAMIDTHLTNHEIKDIAAYILSLKKP